MRSWRLAVLLPMISLVSSSCMKTPELDEKAEPASVQEVQSAMAKSWGNSDPLSMTVNDFVYTETDQRIEQQDPRLVLQEGITVSNKADATNEVNYTYLYQVAVINGTSSQQSTREDHRCVAKNDNGCPDPTPSDGSSDSSDGSSSTTAVPKELRGLSKLQKAAGGSSDIKPYADDYQMSLGFEKFLSLAYACQKSDSLAQYCKDQLGVDTCDIQCSNLAVKEDSQDAPPSMKALANCGGLTDCKIKLKRINFDWSFITKKGTTTHSQKINYSMALSQDLPFLSRLVEYCSRGLVDIPSSGTKVLVTVCNRQKDYKPAPH
ncbi:hypothetical protein [Bdellovibrio sp. NC01]|uniref:hypothetical protein n=1 Tax=Bdellovibrio sp. NC01 TaxID=2220073 RepID=UPI00115A6B9E|nr:hypothetical protein [Bdellovibrio sp. NC01]QDK36626.1 hypothetical protein DOE51_02930 [Bdellovibrio sp. NC01]